MNHEADSGHHFRSYAGVYIVSLAAIGAASLFPEARLWGIGTWARHGIAAPGIAVAVALGLLPLIYRVSRSFQSDDGNSRGYTVVAVSVTVALAAIFAVFHARVHFLGDGYTVLANLAAETPIIKQRSLGESYVHLWVKELIGGEGRAAALLSFRIVSIVAGVLFAGLTFIVGARLFESVRDRLVFAFGILTGGYMLLFFGYVENYSLFALSVGAFMLIGLCAALGRCRRFWILVPLAAAIVCHVLGVLLVPAAVYLVVAPTTPGRRFRRAAVSTRWLLLALAVIGGGFAVWQFAAGSIFVRYSLMPLLHDRTSDAGYTLFSPAHLLDIFNLLWLLLPGLLLLLLALWRSGKFLRTRPVVFLMVLCVSAWMAVFLLDPKLGMPRDWDLFAFAGIPLAGLCYYVLLAGKPRRAGVALLAIVLAAVSLIPRVHQIDSPELAVGRFTDYLDIDPHQDRNGPYLLYDYYQKHGDSTGADSIQAVWEERFPEMAELDSGRVMVDKGNIVGAARHHERVVAKHPDYADAWMSLAECYYRLGSYRKALKAYDMGLGLNPFHAGAYASRSTCYMQLGAYEKALEDMDKARDLMPGNPGFLINLGGIYSRQGKVAAAARVLNEAAGHEETALVAHFSLVQLYAQVGEKGRAQENLEAAVAHGLDSARIRQLLKAYPILEPPNGQGQ